MKKMINTIDELVTESLQGMAQAHPELDINLEPMYITRHNNGKKKVALISGGGSGHEPMHGGYVGLGMLDGACPGAIFTSPTPDQMYECAIKANTGEGVLFLVKNYTGDVLNFETAVELIQDEGIPVQLALIDDDVAVKDSLYTAGRRGVETTVIAEKILGAAAEDGYKLSRMTALATRIANQGRTFSVALHACTVPAAGKLSFDLGDNEIEFGVGIHGEPGIERREFTDSDTITTAMMEQILDNTPYERVVRHWNNENADWIESKEITEPLNANDKVIVMINNLGSVPQTELYIVYRKVAQILGEANIEIVRNMVGTYCTSLDMQGVSITVLKVDDEMLLLFDKPVATPALRWGC